MFDKILKNKYFTVFLIVAFVLYSFSFKVARADEADWLFEGIGLILGFAITWLASVWCGGCLGYLYLSLTVPVIIQISVFAAVVGLTYTVGTVVAGRSFCIGLSHALGNCGQGESPDIYFTGTGSPQLNLPAPTISSKNLSATCDSVTLDYSLLNIGKYAIYRDGALITQSETCVSRSGAETPYVFSYVDSGRSPGTKYTYSLVVSDVIGQEFRFPDEEITTKTPPSCN